MGNTGAMFQGNSSSIRLTGRALDDEMQISFGINAIRRAESIRLSSSAWTSSCQTKMSVATWKRSLGLLGIEWRERVESVSSQMQEAAALVAKGVDKTRLQAQGHGASNPIADNTTEDGRGKNLRVKLVRVGA
jgi:hypothetical protein